MRYFAIIDGCSVNDIIENDGGYNYYLFLRPGGSGVVMRESTAGTEFRFSVFGTFDETTHWTNRSSLNFKRTSDFKKL
jgi:hypothetical protein